MRKLVMLVSVVLCLVAFPFAAQGVSVVWDFSTDTPGDVGSDTHTYLDNTNTYPLTAYARITQFASPLTASIGDFWTTGTVSPVNLYGKTDPPPENGLGILGINADNEIEEATFVQLDVTTLLTRLTAMNMTIASIQAHAGEPGEGYYLWGSNTLNVPGQLLKQGRNPADGGDVQSFTLPDWGQFDFYSISSTSHPVTQSASDVLIQDGASSTVIPEPATLTLLGLGGVVTMLRRKLKK